MTDITSGMTSWVLFLCLAALLGCGRDPSTPPEIIRELKTGEVTAEKKQQAFEALRNHTNNPDVLSFLVGAVREPYVCYPPAYRLAGEKLGDNSIRGVVACVQVMAIEALPDEPKKDILQVLLESLDVTTRARFGSVRRTLLRTVRADGLSPPVRECARAKLAEITGLNFAYDKAKWKRAILDRYGFEVR